MGEIFNSFFHLKRCSLSYCDSCLLLCNIWRFPQAIKYGSCIY